MKHLTLLAFTSLVISGCAVHGDSDFSCPDPEQGVCMNAGDAYKAAENGYEAKDFIRTETGEVVKRVNGSSSNRLSAHAPVVGVMSTPVSAPKPVMAAPEVIKVWVNVWEDEAQVLHMPTTAYVEITPRRWSLDGTEVHKTKSASPFKRVTRVTN